MSGYGTSMHFPYCRDGRCTGCLPPPSLPAALAVSEIPLGAVRCDATVPSYYDDEVRFGCGHEADAEALWIDGKWHPRCERHVNGYPASRVRPLAGQS